MNKIELFIGTLDVDNVIVLRESLINDMVEANYESVNDIGYKENNAIIDFLKAVIDYKLSLM